MNLNVHLSLQSAFSKPDPIGPRALNPQPLPPKAFDATAKDLLGPRALNPQPLPPKARALAIKDPIGPRALDSQPLPSRIYAHGISDAFSKVALNPQPLPPKEADGPHIGPPLPDPPFSLAKLFSQVFAKMKGAFAM